jgi:hypothetical protein
VAGAAAAAAVEEKKQIAMQLKHAIRGSGIAPRDEAVLDWRFENIDGFPYRGCQTQDKATQTMQQCILTTIVIGGDNIKANAMGQLTDGRR